MRNRASDRSSTPRLRAGLPVVGLVAVLVAAAWVPVVAQEPPAAPEPAPVVAQETPAAEAPASPSAEPGEPAAAPEPEIDWDSSGERDAAPRQVRKDTQVVVGSDLVVERNERVRDVVVIGGNLEVLGEVDGDAAALGGRARIDGEVDGDVVAIGGNVELGPGARVRGDVTSAGGSVEADPDARVDGQISEVPIGSGMRFGMPHLGSRWFRGWTGDWNDGWHWRPFSGLLSFFWETVELGILILLACLVLVLAPNATDRIARTAAQDPLKSGIVGLAVQILSVPTLIILILVLVVSIIGIPLLILVPFVVLALVVVAFVGFVAGALQVGRWLSARFGWELSTVYITLIVGLVAIKGWGLVGELLEIPGGPLRFFAWMFQLFGGLLGYLVMTVGFGAALSSRVGRDGGGGTAGVAPVPLPPPPPPAPAPPAAPAEPARSVSEASMAEASAAAEGPEAGPAPADGTESEPPGDDPSRAG